jgi:membrane-associated phospholipid phosphatase
MIRLLLSNWFFRAFCFLMLALAGLVFFFEKGRIELALNTYHHPILDYLFVFFTNVGDGITLCILIAVVLWFSRYKGLLLTLSYILSTIITQFLKRIIFPDMERPSLFFKDHETIYYVKSITIHAYNSFPSGHTSAAFCVLGAMALIMPRYALHFFCTAFMVGFSRVYLMQHFVMDTFTGAAVGFCSTIAIWFLLEQKFSNTHLLNRPLLNTNRSSKSSIE